MLTFLYVASCRPPNKQNIISVVTLRFSCRDIDIPHDVCALEFCTGVGAVKSRGKTAGVPREREERPPFIPRKCPEQDWLLRESRGTGSHPRFPNRPIVTAVRPIFTIIAVFIMLLILGTLSTIFWMNTFLVCVRFYAAWYELRKHSS